MIGQCDAGGQRQCKRDSTSETAGYKKGGDSTARHEVFSVVVFGLETGIELKCTPANEK
jgi:hypothetical protein